MKQIYGISLILLPFFCFSQLYIKPYGNQESYMYVEGSVLYVEKNIDLKKNPEGSFAASIFLRNEAQLLQGKEDEKNSGDGMLSVFQEGRATAYTYNYWGLPVQNTFTSSNSIQNIIHEPLSITASRPALVTTNYNGYANPLTISSRWIFKLSGWGYYSWKYIGDNFDLKPGEGFTMKGVDGVNTEIQLYGIDNNPGGEQRYDFRGLPHTGTIELDLIKDEIRLVGNPYPSALDLNAFLIENTNSTGIAYFWDSRPVASHNLQDYEGGYGAYSPALGREGYVPPVFQKFNNNGEATDNTGNTGEYYARRFSPIGQGFIIEGLETGKIYFKNKYRVFQKENPVFSEFKSTLKSSPKGETISMIRINVEFKDLYTRQLLIAFHPGSTEGVDRAMDAKNFSPLEKDVGFFNENEQYLIDVRPFKTEIPLKITVSTPVEIKFELNSNNFNEDVFLWDTKKNIYYNLKNQQVTIPIDPSELTDQFKITFSSEVIAEKILPVAGLVNHEFKIFQNNPFHRAEILAPNYITPKLVGLYDISGKKIKEIKGVENEFYYEIPTDNLPKGIYIVKIISRDGTIVTKKVIISNL